MPRQQTAVLRQRYRCGVLVPHSYETNNDGTPVMVPCGKSEKAHHPSVGVKKKGELKGQKVTKPAKVQDHEFADRIALDVKCGGCHRVIEPGEKYRYWIRRMGGKVIRCKDCPNPPRSFFTGSEIYAMAWDIADQEVPEFTSMEEFDDWKAELVNQIEEIVDLIDEKLSAIEDGMGGPIGPVYEELESRKGEYEGWQDEVDSTYPEEPEECTNCGVTQEDHGDHGFVPDEESDSDACDDCGIAEADHSCDEYEGDMTYLSDLASDLLSACPE